MAFQAIKLDCFVYFDQKNGFLLEARVFNESILFTCSLTKAIFLLLVKCDVLIKMHKIYTSLIEWDVCIFYWSQ
jgi:hypothetical protein